MVDLLANNPLLLLFLVMAVGFPLGRIKIRGSTFGVASVLFVGLAAGALDPRLKLPEVVSQLGLTLFVYTIGLSSARTFFESLRGPGLRYNALVLGMLATGAALTVGLQRGLGIPAAQAAGMFAGSFTNTPALAGALDYLKANAGLSGAGLEALLVEPVVGYSLTYPVGVLGMLLALALMRRAWRADRHRDAARLRQLGMLADPLRSRTIRVSQPPITRIPLHELLHQHDWDVVFTRLYRAGSLSLAAGDTTLQMGDLVTAVGTVAQLDAVTRALGETSSQEITHDHSQLDFIRVFVSSPHVIGRRLRDLRLREQFGALVSRVRHGDKDMVPHGDTILSVGDRVRVVAPRDRLASVRIFFGDSYRAVSEVDVLTFSLGIALGMLIGLLPIPLPGGLSISLGLAGGPLLVALVLGRLERTGPLVWTLPYSANLTLRQTGLVLFLAGVGTRAGYAFVDTLLYGSGLLTFAAGAALTGAIGFATLWIGHRLLQIPADLLAGILSGLQTQPAVLGFALEQADNDAPDAGYASVLPMAIIAKIVLAQLVLVAMMR